MMSNYRFASFFIAIGFLFLVPSLSAQNIVGPPPQGRQTPGMSPGMPPAKMQEFQKEMEEFQKEFEALSPAEQESFFKSMDEAVKKIDDLSKTPEGKELLTKLEKGTISDAELDSLINQLVEEEAPDKDKKEAPEPKIEEKEPEIPKQVITTAHEKIIDTLGSFIIHTHAFIMKALTYVEFPSKVRHWERKRYIKLKDKQNWNELKTALEQLVSKLEVLLERDPITKEYYHIDELLKKESLHNNIMKIEKNIARLQPFVQEASTTDVTQPMSKDSKKGFQDLINEYYEALYVLNIPEEISKLLTLFDPKAKKYREAEEKAAQQAELLGKPKAVAPVSTVTGRPAAQTPSYAPTQPSYRPYTPTTYTPPRNGRPVSRPYSAPLTKDEDKKRVPSTKKKNGDKEKEKTKEDKAEKEKEPAEMRAHTQLNKEIDAALSKIEDLLKEANDIIKTNELVKKLNSVFIDTSPIDVSLAVEVLPELNKSLSIKKGVLGEIHQLHRKLKTAANRQAARKPLAAKYNKNKKALSDLHGKLNTMEKEWGAIKRAVPADKKYAYFGMKDIEIAIPEDATKEELEVLNQQKEQLEQTKSKVFAPYSVFDINALITNIEKAIQDFAKPKLPEEK